MGSIESLLLDFMFQNQKKNSVSTNHPQGNRISPNRMTSTNPNSTLTPFSVNLQTYLLSNPTISRLITSAVVIHHSPTPRVLLLQRAASDGFPLRWECPGGSVDSSDQTILHALERELLEETGLSLSKVVDMLDGEVEFQWGDGICRKVTFLVEVDVGEGREEASKVVLNPEEHADFVWATEEDVIAGRCEGREIRFAYETTKGMILDGLAMVRE